MGLTRWHSDTQWCFINMFLADCDGSGIISFNRLNIAKKIVQVSQILPNFTSSVRKQVIFFYQCLVLKWPIIVLISLTLDESE